MRAWTYDSAGSARDVMRNVTLDMPAPGPGEVLVEVKISAVNPTDVKRRTTGRELDLFKPIIPNNDGTGIIAAVGEGVSASRIGERVWLFGAQAGRPNGTAATIHRHPVNPGDPAAGQGQFHRWRMCRRSGGYSLARGAGRRADDRQDRAGDRCRWAALDATPCRSPHQSGATVIATTRAGNFDEVSRLGAHHVIDYTANGIGEALATAAPDGIDRVADGALWLTLDVSAARRCKARAQVAAYASDQQRHPCTAVCQAALCQHHHRDLFDLRHVASSETGRHRAASTTCWRKARWTTRSVRASVSMT
jgi:NADPH2:quinone reductase